MKITRPIGAQMIRILELCEKDGLSYAQIDKEMGYKFAYVVAFRAWQLGLMQRTDDKPKRYISVADWRESPYMPKKIAIQPQMSVSVPKGCSFIFNMGVQ